VGKTAELGFIGAGNMATAICRGIVRAGLIGADEIIAADPDETRRSRFEAATGARTTTVNADACRSRVLVFSVKPRVLPEVLEEVGPLLRGDILIISIVAGAPARVIEVAAPRPVRVVRAMPNTPMLVGEGAAAVCRGAHATDQDLARAVELFSASATVIEVDEESMHAVTALSGSGPAYLFYLAETMIRAGVEMGLSEADAAVLTKKTLFGAGKMLIETGESPGELRGAVTTPGGTTEAALSSMARASVAEHIIAGIKAACRRSRELSDGRG